MTVLRAYTLSQLLYVSVSGRAIDTFSFIDHIIMPRITQIEYFRVPPRWLFVKITDEAGNVGWGEASLEGHTQAVEGCLDAYIERFTGLEAKFVSNAHHDELNADHCISVISSRSGSSGGEVDSTEVGQFS